MDWWIYLLIALGAVILLVLILSLVKRIKSRKKVKAKKASPKPKAEEKKEDDFDGIIFEEEQPAPEVKKTDSGEFETTPYGASEDEEFDAEAEKRYQDFMARHDKIEKMFEENKSEKKEKLDDFEEFRNQYCYSKYVTDTVLAEKLKDLPPETRKMMLEDLFKSIDSNNFDIKL